MQTAARRQTEELLMSLLPDRLARKFIMLGPQSLSYLWVLLVAIAGCGDDSTADKTSEKSDARPRDAQACFYIPDNAMKIETGSAPYEPGVSIILYRIPEAYPAADYLAGLAAFLSSRDWVTLDYDLQFIGKKRGWFDYRPNDPNKHMLAWTGWWVNRAREALYVDISVFCAPGLTRIPSETVVTIKHYDAPAVADLLEHYKNNYGSPWERPESQPD
jgi:hypothetical protein